MNERCNCDSPMAWCEEHDPTPWTRAGYDEQGRRIKAEHCDMTPVEVPAAGHFLVMNGKVVQLDSRFTEYMDGSPWIEGKVLEDDDE